MQELPTTHLCTKHTTLVELQEENYKEVACQLQCKRELFTCRHEAHVGTTCRYVAHHIINTLVHDFITLLDNGLEKTSLVQQG